MDGSEPSRPSRRPLYLIGGTVTVALIGGITAAVLADGRDPVSSSSVVIPTSTAAPATTTVTTPTFTFSPQPTTHR